MDTGIELPNGHLLNLNPRPRNNSNPNNRQNREAAVVQDSKLPTPESNGKIKSRLDSGKDSGTMPKSSPTSLPVPKSFADKAKDQKKRKSVTIVDNENQTTTATADSRCPKAESMLPMTPQSGDTTDRETRLRKIQERLNKDSPLVAKSKEKQKEHSKGAYQKIVSLTNDPQQEGAKTNLRSSEANTNDITKLPKPGGKARTGIPSPSDKPRTASGGLFRSPAVHHAPNQKRGPLKLQQKRPQQPNEEPCNDFSSQESSIKTDKTVDSSSNSLPSVSPISGPSSSATEWEDKFVVNMPSAKDPNPPMMTAQQIIEFQRSIEKVQREGGAMADPDTSPSPRTTTPEDLRAAEAPEKAAGRGGSEPNANENANANANANTDTPTKEGNGPCRRYYSPEEVGKQRFSTIWEESPSKTKKQGTANGEDGFFLGCKEIKGPEKNPDEILYFSTTKERPKVIDIPSPISGKPRVAGKPTGRRMVRTLDDKIQIQKEWRTISDNLKKRQSSMPLPRTLCHEPACPQPGRSEMSLPKAPGKENGQALRSSSNPISNTSTDKEVDSPGGDDVVMNIPNVLHAPAVPDTNAPRPQLKTRSMPASRLSAPPKPLSGLRQSSLGKDDAKSKAPSSSTTSRSPPIKTSIHINKSRGQQMERPPGNERVVRGYMRIPGLVNSSTENFTESVRPNLPRTSLQTSMSKDGAIADVNVPSRSVSGPAQVTPDSSSLRGGSPVSAHFKDESRDAHNTTTTTTPSARIIEVAELDGHQLHSETRRRKTFSPSIATVSSSRTATTTTETSSNDTDSIDGEDQDSGPYPLTLNLLFDILIISVTHFQRLTGDCLNSQYPQMVLRAVVGMVEHCIHVSRCALLAIAVYRTTGTWPKAGQFDLGRSLTDLGQALVYLVALGFVMIIIGRAAGYIVLVGSWVVWFAKPFGWTFGLLARALAP